jgi:hypothetical protein
MSGAGSLGGRGLGASCGISAGDQHQLVLVAALRQPAGGEGVLELVGHSRKPRGPGPVVQGVVERLADSVLRLAE